jgi:histidinol-phosphate/aromatic aminotransferase/cobyric acid decarboxylase-like protein
MALAGAWLQTGESAMRAHVARVRDERAALFELLAELGAEAQPSQANFVLARFRDAPSTWAGLAREGIAVRAFWEHAQLADCLRITCPGDAADYCRLEAALRRVMSGAKEAT